MEWFLGALRSHPEIAFFLSLALGYALGSVRLGTFTLGPVLGTLIAGLAVGQIGVDVSGPMQAAFFLMFLFAIGFRTGPEFFQGLRSSAVPQVAITVLLCVCALGCTWGLALLCGFDGGTAAGLLAGAQTSSTALGTATQAAAGLGLDAEHAAAVAHNVATGYALTYFLGTLLVVWFLPAIGPRLMRVNLADACRQLEQQMGLQTSDPAVGSAYREVVARAYRLPASLAGRSVAQVEALWPASQRVIVGRVRRGDALIEALPAMQLEDGDVVAVAGGQEALLAADAPLRDEVLDRELLAVPTVSADLVLTHRRLSGQTLSALGRELVARGVFLRKLRRAGRELPFNRADGRRTRGRHDRRGGAVRGRAPRRRRRLRRVRELDDRPAGGRGDHRPGRLDRLAVAQARSVQPSGSARRWESFSRDWRSGTCAPCTRGSGAFPMRRSRSSSPSASRGSWHVAGPSRIRDPGRIAIDTIATAGIERPMLASAEPSARLRLVCRRLALAARTADRPSGSRTIAAMAMPTTACGAPRRATPASRAGDTALAIRTTAPSATSRSAALASVARVEGGGRCSSSPPVACGRK